ncbi:Calcium-activated chloride channel regulator 4A [Portunus trituberculatus]|uniref:Calcium-activated chloride channel regulator 4A n=1 Tax=Portunus trituberculatus TaxID=210409 RepID=A0A5B7J681_PORTR|nr:Calcium-activated chloride channel regulator 4A [Portunus trituberculatus]
MTGHVLMHEWAHYRWGVFEEYGHPKDPVYPVSYERDDLTRPTACYRGKLLGDFLTGLVTSVEVSSVRSRQEGRDTILDMENPKSRAQELTMTPRIPAISSLTPAATLPLPSPHSCHTLFSP